MKVDGGIGSDLSRAGTEARETPRAEPKACSRARLRPGPTPSISSSGFFFMSMARRVRWVPMAKRWASSRNRCR